MATQNPFRASAGKEQTSAKTNPFRRAAQESSNPFRGQGTQESGFIEQNFAPTERISEQRSPSIKERFEFTRDAIKRSDKLMTELEDLDPNAEIKMITMPLTFRQTLSPEALDKHNELQAAQTEAILGEVSLATSPIAIPFERGVAALTNPLLQIQAGNVNVASFNPLSSLSPEGREQQKENSRRFFNAFMRGLSGNEMGDVGEIFAQSAIALGATDRQQSIARGVGLGAEMALLFAGPKALSSTASKASSKVDRFRDTQKQLTKMRNEGLDAVDPPLQPSRNLPGPAGTRQPGRTPGIPDDPKIADKLRSDKLKAYAQTTKENIEAGSARLGAPSDPATKGQVLRSQRKLERQALITAPEVLKGQETNFLKRKFIIPAETTLRRLGPSGDALADTLVGIRNRSADMIGGNLRDLEITMSRFNRRELKNFIPAFNGKEKPVSGNVALAIDMFKDARAALFTKAKALNVETIDPFTSKRSPIKFNPEFPKMFSPGFFDKKKNKDKIILTLVKQGKAKTANEARLALERQSAAVRRQGNLERPKYFDSIESDITDPREIVNRFVRGESRRLAEIEAFGQDPINAITGLPRGILKDMLDEVGKATGSSKTAQQIVERYIGALRADEEIGVAIQTALNTNAAMSLSLAKLSQFQDRIRTIAVSSVPTYRQAARYARTRAGMRWAIESLGETPITSSPAIELLTRGKVTDFLLNKVYRIAPTDFKNRIIAAAVGRMESQKVFKLLKKDPGNIYGQWKLGQFGIDTGSALRRGYLTREDLIKAARSADRFTQRRDKVLDFPLVFSSDSTVDRFTSQFRGPAFDVSRFMFEEIGRVQNMLKTPGMRGVALGRLARLIGSVTVIGGSVATVRAGLRGRLTDGLSGVMRDTVRENLGLISDAATSPRFGPGSALEFAAGAVPSTVSEFLYRLWKALGGDPDLLLDFLKRRTPGLNIIGGLLDSEEPSSGLTTELGVDFSGSLGSDFEAPF